MKLSIFTALFLALCLSMSLRAQEPVRPCLIIQADQVEGLRAARESNPLWAKNVDSFLETADGILELEIEVPVPRDPAGGYTHTQHKVNAISIKHLGVSYLLSGELKYAEHARDILLEYAEEYPKYGTHPVRKSYAPGKLFWQQLNEAVWLTDAIQGYDAIYESLSKKDRKTIEKELLRPFADFLSIENQKVFDRMHNHGVWAVVGVGMTGIVLGDQELIDRALEGINQEAGFARQTLTLFSPDGYYTEGPYYQRYAMTPFLLMAQSLENNLPELNIMELGGGIYEKAVRTLIDLTDASGRYFPINDNLRGMTLQASSGINALCFLYANTEDPAILSLLEGESFASLDANSLKVAEDLQQGRAQKLNKPSRFIHDGEKGDMGGLALIRNEESEFCTVFKYASHGLSHGHFDRLNINIFHGASEVLTDYGSSRFVNIKAKEGGRYLPENDSYVKQSIAHNTVVVDQTSHFQGIYKDAQATHAELVHGDLENEDLQVVCAHEAAAYPGVEMTRVIVSLKDPAFESPLLVDLFSIRAEHAHSSYDLPYHFRGNILHTGFVSKSFDTAMKPFGTDHGYQHLWKTAEGKAEGNMASLSWLHEQVIYTLSTATTEKTELFLAASGANDPNFNLRFDPAFILRENGARDHLFATVLESHGRQNTLSEIVRDQEPRIRDLRVLHSSPAFAAVAFFTAGQRFLFVTTLENGGEEELHSLELAGEKFEWKGNYTLIKTEIQ